MNLIRQSLALGAALSLSMLSTASAQVLDADCFTGNCGGKKGVPQCPEGYREVGLVLYANSKANDTRDCETVVSCTNLSRSNVNISCRFYHGFNPIRPGGPTDALCSAFTPDVAPGDTNECATDSTPAPGFQTGGIFLAGDGNCPTFEGKGLVCVKGGDPERVFCQAHLVCGRGTVLEKINVVPRKKIDPSENSKGKIKDRPPGQAKR